MPRKGKPGGEAHRHRQRRYRARLAGAGRPEASAVDIAVAAAVASLAGAAARDPSIDSSPLRRILRDAVTRLGEAGFDRDQARHVVVRRIGRYERALPALGDTA